MKLSYIVATYNCPHWLDLHLANLIEGQTDRDFEVLVVHHESPNYDREVGEKWAAIDDRVRNLDDKDYGCYAPAWIHGWKHAKGDFVVNSNTDDFHHPDFTSEFHKHMTLATKGVLSPYPIAFGYAGMQVVREDGRMVGAGLKPAFDFELMTRECWGGPQVCWRNDDDFRQTVDWDLMLDRAKSYHSAYDYWLWLYFLSLGYHGYVIQKILTIYTQRDGSVENANKWQNNWETYASISEFFGHNFDGHLKHAREFRDFHTLPPKDKWVETMQAGKKWKRSKRGGTN